MSTSAEPAVTPGQRLLGLAVAGFGILAVLTVFVRQHARVVDSFDPAVHEAAVSYMLAHPTGLALAAWITHLGDTLIVALVDICAVALLLALRLPRTALFVAVAAVSVWALRIGWSRLVARPRPPDALWSPDGFAFPSGHAANSAAMGVIVVVAGWTLAGRTGRIALIAVAATVTLGVGVSRVAGGVHYPTDILAGWLLAAAVTALAAALLSPHFPPDRSAGEVSSAG